ncbi:HET-s domain [Zalerion maritima]|uniref:HET-s domain n=1 Tax=Zalerion maritima TaxID=339359 RepID=A0AAD5WWM9_9PEZI|nr:HET-s domain [Zalerion maritima]
MNFLGSMTGLNLPGMSPFGGGEKKSFLEEGISGSWSPMPGFQPFNPSSNTSFFKPGDATGNATGSAFNTFYNDMFQFEDDLDDVESKIDEWEDGWGVDPEEDFEKQTSPVFQENGVEAENRLTRIYRTRDNLRKTRTRFAGVEVTTDRPVRHGRTAQGGVRVDTGKTRRRLGGIQINIDSNAAQQQNRGQQDVDKFPGGRVQELQNDLTSSTETLADLNRQINDLNRRLPPPDKRVTAAGEPQKMPGVGEDSSDSDRDLKGLSGLRQMVLEVRRMNQAQAQRKQVTFPNPPEDWVIRATEKRYWAEYERDGRMENVLVEWKAVINAANPPPPHTTFTFKNMVRVKIESLTSQLKIPENVRPAGLRMLNCLGVFRRTNDDEVSYGLVFEVPSKKHQSLLQVLRRDAGFVKQSSLMIMARALAKAVLYLHLARWLHKGIRSNSILLFPKDDGSIDFSEPYLVGYEYTRQAGKISLTEQDDDFVSNLYRHPRMQGLPQDQSSPTGSGGGMRDESPSKPRQDPGSGSGDSPPAGTIPAPLVVRRDRASSNPNAPPLLVRRDSGVARTNHRRQDSSFDRPELLRRDSDKEKSPFQSFHDIYALGIVLLEVGLREPIKSVYERAKKDPIYGKHFAEKFRQWILADEVPRLGITVGDKYQEAVTACLDDSLEGLSDQELQKEFYSRVVRVLANITAHL